MPGGGLPGSLSSLRNAAITCWPEGPLTTPMRTLLRSRLGSSAALGAADSDCVRLPVRVLRRRCVFSPCQTRWPFSMPSTSACRADAKQKSCPWYVGRHAPSTSCQAWDMHSSVPSGSMQLGKCAAWLWTVMPAMPPWYPAQVFHKQKAAQLAMLCEANPAVLQLWGKGSR